MQDVVQLAVPPRADRHVARQVVVHHDIEVHLRRANFQHTMADFLLSRSRKTRGEQQEQHQLRVVVKVDGDGTVPLANFSS